MAHYDCSFCGERMGIDIGFCNKCTPKEYFETEKELHKLIAKRDKWFRDLEAKLLPKYNDKSGIDRLRAKLDEIIKEEKEKRAAKWK